MDSISCLICNSREYCHSNIMKHFNFVIGRSKGKSGDIILDERRRIRYRDYYEYRAMECNNYSEMMDNFYNQYENRIGIIEGKENINYFSKVRCVTLFQWGVGNGGDIDKLNEYSSKFSNHIKEKNINKKKCLKYNENKAKSEELLNIQRGLR